MYGDVGKVGKRIPLTTLWLGVVRGIQVSALCDMVGWCGRCPTLSVFAHTVRTVGVRPTPPHLRESRSGPLAGQRGPHGQD